MKRTLYLLSLLTLAACSNDENVAPEVDDNRTEIAFSSNLSTEASARPMTRALTEDGFTAETRIVMRIKSEDGSTTPTETKYTRTVATAAAKGTDSKSSVSFGSGNKRYWDEAHGRNSKLSVYAVAVENTTTDDKLTNDKLQGGSTTWFTETTENENIEWTVSTTQTTTSIDQENLVYSNNIQNSSGGTDNRLKFNEGTNGHGTFDKGELKFNHALTRIQVNLTYSSEFTDMGSWSESDVKGVLPTAHVSGSLDLKTGLWTIKSGDEGIKEVTMALKTSKTQYIAQILPDMQLVDGSDANVIAFTVKGNVYYITSDVLYDKLNSQTGALSDDHKLLQGKHYIINVKLTKTQISAISAKVVGWNQVDVNDVEPSNAYISLSLYDNTTGASCPMTSVNLYRLGQTESTPGTGNTNPTDLKSWDGTYEGPATLSESGTTNVYKTNWNFESNAIYYHFRTTNQTLNSGNKDFSIQSGYDGSSNPLDPHWGAPMATQPTYDKEKGFGDYIHAAIGVTKDPIKITEFHMLSEVIIKLTTTDGTDKVENLDQAKVELLQLANIGSVNMGNGLITPSSTIASNHELNYNSTKSGFFSPIVPQSLNRGSNATVGIRITAKDNNVYQVEDISKYTVKTTTNAGLHAASSQVDRWYPGTQYTYTFTLKKTGIETVTCTVTNWDEVTVDGGDITIQ